MTIVYRGIGTTLSTGTGTVIAPAYPTFSPIVAGDLLLAILHFKPTAAGTPVVVTAPAGWWQVASKTGGGYGATLGADTGNTTTFVFAAIASGNDGAGPTFTATGHNVSLTTTLHLSSSIGWGQIKASTGDQSVVPVNPVTILTSEQVKVKPGDFLVATMGLPTDSISSPGTVFSAPVLTHSGGSTINIPTTIRTTWTSTNNDLGLVAMTATVPTGTSSGTGTFTFNSPFSGGLALTNIRGPFIVVRLTEGGASVPVPVNVAVVSPAVQRESTAFSIPKVEVASPQALLTIGVKVASICEIVVASPEAVLGVGGVANGDMRASLSITAGAAASLNATTATAAAAAGETRPVEVQLWSPDNRSLLAIADGRSEVAWVDDFNDSGKGDFALHRYDPKATRENLAMLNIVKFVYGGKVRFSSRIESRGTDVVGSNDHESQVWSISGRGVLSMLSDAVVYPEYGVDEFTKDKRSFFFGSKEGAWYVASEWTTPRGLPLSAVPVDHPWTGFPAEWPDPDSQWLWSSDPNTVSVPTTHWFRSYFTLEKATTVKVYASADDKVLLYVDGYPVLATVDGDKHSFRKTSQFSLNLGEGRHLIAAEVVNTNDTIAEVKPPISSISPTYASDSNRPYIGRGFTDGGNKYVNSNGSVDGGGTGAAAFDGNDGTYWMSVGNYLGWSSAYEWVEGTFPAARLTAVRVKVRGGPYTVYISVRDGGNGWNGGDTIPYKARVVDAGTRIRYVQTARIGRDGDATINIPPQNADRVRITLKADWDSGIWQYRWRAAIYSVVVTSEPREGSYVRGGNFAGLLVAVAEVDDAGAVTRIVHRSQPTGWLVKTGERPGWRPAHILIALIGEAKLRNVLGILPLQLGFTDTTDSYGKPWTTPRKDVAYSTGDDYLSVVRKITEDSDVDVWMEVGGLVLHAAPSRGRNATIGPDAVVLIPGNSVTDLSVDNRRPQSTRMLVETEYGWMEAGNFESETTYGRVEGLVSFGNALSLQEARTSANKELERFSIEGYDTTVSLTDLIGPRPYKDYEPGDVVLAPTGFGTTYAAYRIMSVSVREGDAGELDVSVELDREQAIEELTPPGASDQFPGNEEIGVPDDAQLSVLTSFNNPNSGDTISGGVLTIDTPNAVYENWTIPYLVRVTAAGVVLRNCRVTGLGVMPENSALVQVRTDVAASATINRCTLIPDFPSANVDGIRGSNFTATNCEISATMDGIHIYGPAGDRTSSRAGNVTVSGCWIHDLRTYSDSGQPDGLTQNDGIQIVGGRNITISGNRFEQGMRNAGVMVTQAVNDVGGLTIRDNLFLNSGTSGINIYDSQGPSPIPGLTIFGNTFRKGLQKYSAIVSGRTIDAGAVFMSNVWEDGSTPPPPLNRGA